MLAARSTLSFHISTYAFALLNQSVNLWYALVRNDPALITHRFFGVIFNAYYVYVFLTYCPPAKATAFWTTLSRAGWCFAVVFVDLNLALPLLNMEELYFKHFAFFGAMTGIGLAAGPLATIVRGWTGRGWGCASAGVCDACPPYPLTHSLTPTHNHRARSCAPTTPPPSPCRFWPR